MEELVLKTIACGRERFDWRDNGGGRVAHTQVLGWGSLMLQKSQQFGDIISEALLPKSTEPKQKVTEGSQLEESLEPDFGA